MKTTERLILLISIMTGISVSVAFLTIIILYKAALNEDKKGLRELATSQSYLIEAMYNKTGNAGLVLNTVKSSYLKFHGKGITGEFSIAELIHNTSGKSSIVFLIDRHDGKWNTDNPIPYPGDNTAQGLKLAVSGHSGIIIDRDNHREEVLSAYHNISGLDWGIVEKIDMSEIRAPYVQASLISFIIMFSLVVPGAFLFIKITNPLIRKIKDNEERYRQLYKKIRNVNSSLEEEIEKRKAAEAELDKTFSELMRSNKDLEQFAYVASHDLQEPMRMVASYTKLIYDRYRGKLDKDTKTFMEFAMDGSKRMQELLEGLLTYSRVETRQHILVRVNCNKVLEQVKKNIIVLLEESSARIISGDLPEVYYDGVQLIQLFQNLISNAVKFHGSEPPEVRVSAEEGEKEWTFSVRDNGIGIDRQHFDKIFLIFQRLHGHEYQGSGIGLSICKKIAERFGGRIWVESVPGKGSTFHFTIPIVTEEEIVPPPRDDLKILYEMSDSGDIAGIRKYIEKNESGNPELLPFISKLKSIAVNIDLKEIHEFISRFIDPDDC